MASNFPTKTQTQPWGVGGLQTPEQPAGSYRLYCSVTAVSLAVPFAVSQPSSRQSPNVLFHRNASAGVPAACSSTTGCGKPWTIHLPAILLPQSVGDADSSTFPFALVANSHRISKLVDSYGVTTMAAIRAEGGRLAWLFYTQTVHGWERFRSAVVELAPP